MITGAFEQFKAQITCVLDTNASTAGTEAMLAQRDWYKPDSPLKAGAFFFRTLSSTEKKITAQLIENCSLSF